MYEFWDLSRANYQDRPYRTFETFDELLKYVSRHYKTYPIESYTIQDMQLNHSFENELLNNINITGRDVYYNAYYDCYFLRPYIFYDPDDRVLDLRLYHDRMINMAKYPRMIHMRRSMPYNDPNWRNGPIDIPSWKRKGGFRKVYRHPKTMNEKRQAIEFKEYIRPNRRVNSLVDLYYDIPRCHQKNWKSNSKKRKQYMKG